MSMQPRPWPEVPALTAQVARAAFPHGSLAIRIRDQLGAWCEDEAFAGIYGIRGAPGISPAQLAVIAALQFAENLTDRQAADEMRGRIDWKYCLGLELADPGFDFSVLSEFRSRLVAGGQEKLLLDLLLTRLKEAGLLEAGLRQRTDSTHVLARIRELNRLELAGEAVRAALEALAAAAPGWLASVTDPSWQRVYGQRITDLRLPESKAARAELAAQYARDGYHLLEQAYSRAAPPVARELPAVQALRLILLRQFYRETGPGGEKVTWREDAQHGLPPGRTKVVSPYDLDARYGEKRGKGWLGYKAHYSETVSDPAGDDPAAGRPARPNLVTVTQTTHASVPDVVMTRTIHDDMDAAGLPPGEHAVDSGYASAEELLTARARGITLIAPLLADASRQARTGGYTADMFAIDWDAAQVTCPEGAVSQHWSPLPPARPRRDRRPVPRPHLPGLPRPGQMHHRHPDRTAAHLAAPRDPRSRRRRPRRARHQGLAAEIRRPGRRGGPDGPGHPRHRHPPRPLPRPAQNHPRTQHRRRRDQPHPARRLVDLEPARPHPDQPLPATPVRAHRLR